MIWGIDEIVADVTRHVTLRPGDVVLTGTPWHSRPIFPGDTVEVDVDGLGRLSNTVVQSPSPADGCGFRATVTKTSLGVALGSDYRVLKRGEELPTPEQYRSERLGLTATNMATGPQARSHR
jgi:5-oxopent-3-ene-1,2,5-tricarboxylate decarboxylase/2-hydroxyhepta-2,4-diene-1,7-dioate isomerase